MVVLRADPWSPEYGMGLETAGLEEPALPVDPFVESRDWSRAVRPVAGQPEPVVFVDGVRRVEVRLWAEDSGQRVPGVLGTWAVGSVLCDGQASFGEERVGRALVLGGGVALPPPVIRAGGASLRFESRAVAGSEVLAPLAALQELMREAESALASRLAATSGRLVVVDGPLSFLDPTEAPVVGLVKRLVRAYLGPEQDALLPALAPGERTPLFGLGAEPNARFAWYVRLAAVRPPWHDRAGVVRCEVRTGLGLEPARELADRVTAILPGFSGRPPDPRAPQNLAPVGALETRLRHRMGHAAFVRRALQEWLVDRG